PVVDATLRCESKVEVGRHADEVAAERAEASRARRRAHLAEVAERGVEVRDRFGDVAAVQEREADVLLEPRLLLRVAALAVASNEEPGRLAEERKRLFGRRRARRLFAGLEQILLGLLEVLAAAVVVGEHAVELLEAVGVERLDRAGDVQVQPAARLEQDRLV